MSKEKWYAWPRDRLGRLVINSSEEAKQLAEIVQAYPYAKKLLERKIITLDAVINKTKDQALFKLEFGIKTATEVQLLREVLSFAGLRQEKEAYDYVRPQAD